MGLTKYEQETILLFNEDEKTASVYTHNLRSSAVSLNLLRKATSVVCFAVAKDGQNIRFLNAG